MQVEQRFKQVDSAVGKQESARRKCVRPRSGVTREGEECRATEQIHRTQVAHEMGIKWTAVDDSWQRAIPMAGCEQHPQAVSGEQRGKSQTEWFHVDGACLPRHDGRLQTPDETAPGNVTLPGGVSEILGQTEV